MSEFKKTLGIIGLLVAICIYTAVNSPNFLTPINIENTLSWIALFGIISIGVAFVIISGGIDLSIGSVVSLSACVLAWLLTERGAPVWFALTAVTGISLLIGLAHGLLITKVGLQPFVVTLCGLLLYRGLARYLTDDASVGFGTSYTGLKSVVKGEIPVPFIEDFAIPVPFLLLVGLALAAGFVLQYTIYGRYLFALGRNEAAARYSGIRTDRVVISAYVFCSLIAGWGGILFALDLNSIQPSQMGEFYELYAIAAAVLGGCSLRGGEGSILGVVIGTAVMIVLKNAINLLQIPAQLEFAIIGGVILAGVIVDELVRRTVARRRAAQRV
jgi:ribose transport system permease protein